MESKDESRDALLRAPRLQGQTSAYGRQFLAKRVEEESGFLLDFVEIPTRNQAGDVRKLRKTVAWHSVRGILSIACKNQGWQWSSSLADKMADFVLPAYLVEATIGFTDKQIPKLVDYTKRKNKNIRLLAHIEKLVHSLNETGKPLLRAVSLVRQNLGLSCHSRPVPVADMREELRKAVIESLSGKGSTGRRRHRHVEKFRKAAFCELLRRKQTRSEASKIIAAMEGVLGVSQLTATPDEYGKKRRVDAILKQVAPMRESSV